MKASAQNDPRRVGTIWTMDLEKPAPAVTPMIHASFRRIGLEYVPTLAEAMDMDSPAEILKRMEAGRRCYSAWVNGVLAAYGWVSFDEEYIGELNLRIRLPLGEAYIWDCATLTAFRRQHLYSALLGYIVGELSAESLRRVWIGADLGNIASHQGIIRAGFQTVADMVVVRVSAKRRVWVQGHPGVADYLVNKARQVYLDNRDSVWLAPVEEIKATT